MFLDPVADGGSLVGDFRRSNGCGPNCDCLFRRVMEGDVSRDIRQADRKQWRGEVDGDALGEALHRRWRPPNVHVDAASKQRAEEAESLEMVEMQMRQHDVDLVDRVSLDRDTKCTHASS